MRYFFLLFLCIELIFGSYANKLKAEENSVGNAFTSLTFSNFIENTATESSLLTQRKGIGDWIKTPYGKIRLLSRESGTNGLDRILMALDVNVERGFILKETDLKLIQLQNVKDYRLFTPINSRFYRNEGLVYIKSTVFPILLYLQNSYHPVQISVEFNTQYCKDDVCNVDSQNTTLGIQNESNYFTPLSSFIDYSLKYIPATATAEQIKIGALSDDTFWIKLQLPEKIQNPNFLFLNPQTKKNILYTQIQSNIDKKEALFVFKTNEIIEGKEITLFLDDDKQLFSLTAIVQKADIPLFVPVSSNNHVPFSWGIVFLLFSPCLCLLLQRRARNEIVARQIILKDVLGITLGILCGIPIYMLCPYAMLSNSVLWLAFGFILFVFLGVFAYPVTNFGYGLLTAIVPYFSFLNNLQISIPVTFNELIYFFSYLATLNILPFLVFLIKPYWLVKMNRIFEQEYDYRLRFAFFLDTLLFGYLLLLCFI